LDEARFRELRHELNIIDLSNVAWTFAHPTILIMLSCLGVGMDIGGVLFSQWALPPPIVPKLIISFTLAIFDGTCASKTSFGHAPKDNSSWCHTIWLKHRWLRPPPLCKVGFFLDLICLAFWISLGVWILQGMAFIVCILHSWSLHHHNTVPRFYPKPSHPSHLFQMYTCLISWWDSCNLASTTGGSGGSTALPSGCSTQWYFRSGISGTTAGTQTCTPGRYYR
jgi:hypothetical protein